MITCDFILQELHLNMRSEIVAFMRRHNEMLKHTRPGECHIDEYLRDSQMEENSAWGTEVEIIAAATMFSTPIYIFCRHGKHHRWLKYAPVAKSKDSPEEGVAEDSDNCEEHSGEAIYITNFNQHFEPVRRI